MTPMTSKVIPTIRRATVADAAMLTRLGERTFLGAFTGICSPEDMQLYLDSAFTVAQLARELADPRAVFLVAAIESAPAGYAKLMAGSAPEWVTGADPIERERLYADQKWLGHGVGPALMQPCLDCASQAGHRSMFLGVWENNFRAQAFYRKWGFAKVGDHIFMMGADAQTDWWMERTL